MGIAFNPATSTASSRCTHEPKGLEVNSLPPELLIHIFNFTAAIDTFSPLSLSLVCRRWNTLVTKSPSIYQCIRLSDSPTPLEGTGMKPAQFAERQDKLWKRNLTQAKIWVERSRPLPFDVFVELGQGQEQGHRAARDDSNLLGMLSPFYENMQRWKRIAVDDGKRNEEFVFDEFFEAHSRIPKPLDFLNVSICDLGHEDSLSNVPKGLFIPSKEVNAFPVTLLGHDQLFPTSHFLPPSEEESRDNLVANYVVSSLPSSFISHPIQPSGLNSITTLNLSEHSVTLHIRPEALLSFLGVTPNLQKLTFVGWIHADRHAPSSTLPVANLPYLNTLQLRSTCLARSILSCLYAPRLQKLELAHLNVDFEMPLPGFDEAEGSVVQEAHEVGDSEDEANDFSQSPWSDRSTGMGLRALVKRPVLSSYLDLKSSVDADFYFLRSNPPLKMLSMDFTDMRTKDFVWLFPKLDHLEEFVIVASDMSDTVIKLLKPHPCIPVNAVDMDNQSNANPQVTTTTTTRLVLPKLKKLELFNCHRLTGDAILDVLVKRVGFTDSLARIALPMTPPASPPTTSHEPAYISDMLSSSTMQGSGHANTLENLTIVGCDGFWHRHSQVLLKEIDSEERHVKIELS
ncbi:hypothetical protein PQX77_016175 [Marasmius sp. AFHP31]|nr:hypothetical protein PQX77_016175 [Marasmius sp. AFHP31]